MGIFDRLFGASKPLPGVFQFGDGRIISAKEYGNAAASGFIAEPATDSFKDCYGNPKYGEFFPNTDLVRQAPFVAHLYFMAFYTGIYHVYAKDILGVDEITLNEIQVGIADAVENMRTPDGSVFSDQIKSSYIGASLGFSKAITAEIDESQNLDPRAVRPLLSRHSTKLLLGFIEQSYCKPHLEIAALHSDIGVMHMARLNLIDSTPVHMLQILKDHLKIRFLKST